MRTTLAEGYRHGRFTAEDVVLAVRYEIAYEAIRGAVPDAEMAAETLQTFFEEAAGDLPTDDEIELDLLAEIADIDRRERLCD